PRHPSLGGGSEGGSTQPSPRGNHSAPLGSNCGPPPSSLVVRFDEALLARARRHLAAFERRALDVDGRKSAAVALVLLPDEEGRGCFLLTKRAPTVRAHTGQWALPGGRIDAGESPHAAALRELHEELGLRLDE